MPTWALKDASGKIYKTGDPLSYDTQYDTGQKTGGFDDAFYNNLQAEGAGLLPARRTAPI